MPEIAMWTQIMCVVTLIVEKGHVLEDSIDPINICHYVVSIPFILNCAFDSAEIIWCKVMLP